MVASPSLFLAGMAGSVLPIAVVVLVLFGRGKVSSLMSYNFV